jgi:hypothetical protein
MSALDQEWTSLSSVEAAASRLKRVLSLRGNPTVMKSSIQLIENIIRAKTALHLKLVAHRNSGKVDIGGGRIGDLIAQVDAGISSYERMLVRFKDELAAKAMASTNGGAEQAPLNAGSIAKLRSAK